MILLLILGIWIIIKIKILIWFILTRIQVRPLLFKSKDIKHVILLIILILKSILFLQILYIMKIKRVYLFCRCINCGLISTIGRKSIRSSRNSFDFMIVVLSKWKELLAIAATATISFVSIFVWIILIICFFPNTIKLQISFNLNR